MQESMIFLPSLECRTGECDVWYNEGSEPSGQIYNKKVKDMIDRGINASAGMLIVNPNARNTAKIGMGNDMFRKGSIHYVGSEIRAVILNKMMVDTQDDVCVIGGESIAIETALIAAEERSWQLSTMVRTETRWKTM